MGSSPNTTAETGPIAVADPQPTGAPLQRAPVRMGIAPSSVEEGWRLAQMLANSELVPKDFRKKPEDVLVAIQMGMELGLAPMQALASIAVINGRASIWGDGLLALIVSSPIYRDHDEYYEVEGQRCDGLTGDDLKSENAAAVCTFWRQGKREPVTRKFSVGQAKRAGLWGKGGPWSQYPDRMMSQRARGFAARDAFPDLLRGIKTAEEVRDTPEAIDVEPLPQPIQPRRASAAVTEPSATTSPSASASGPQPVEAASPVPRSNGAADSATAQETRGLRITDTKFIKPPQGEPYYEVVAVDGNGESHEFLTRDEQLYKEAASFEGSEHAVAIGWKRAKTPAQKVVSMLVSLNIDETPAGASGGELFT